MTTWNVPVLHLNDLVSCPFNPAHIMRYSRFHNHFVKCQKQHPEDKRKPCPYNYSELIAPEDLKDHVLNCRYKETYGYPKDLKKDEKPRISAPFDIDFGKKIEDGNSVCDGMMEDDEIDSVSVIEGRRSCLMGRSSSKQSSSDYCTSYTESPSVKSWLRDVNSKSESADTESVDVTRSSDLMSSEEPSSDCSPAYNEKPWSAGWLCEGNIKGECTSSDSNNDVTPSEVCSKLSAEIKAKINDPAYEKELSRKLGWGRGRGRGFAFLTSE